LYHEAPATLTYSSSLNGDEDAADLAFLAMTQQRLGQSERARDVLQQLRTATRKQERFDVESEYFLQEAVAILEFDLGFPTNPFAK